MHSPNDYLNPTNFITKFDGSRSKELSRLYRLGKALGKVATMILIAKDGTWFAIFKRGRKDKYCYTEHRRIGTHLGEAFRLAGFIDSGCKIKVQREDNVITEIQ